MAGGLIEAFHAGLKFTRRSGEAKKISSRLDRALDNAELFNQIPNIKITILPSSTSDHCPLLVQFSEEINTQKGKPFRYANHCILSKATTMPLILTSSKFQMVSSCTSL